ncbi:hypothetical protein TWF696_009840 [Orbilia brochopaga]|uniref:Shugoshin C-terminal domain-containing protein n=1 Tax=Orbilia brochopaga TaxID=3140254 RepID=A0AAV9UCF9_9PEZI
MAKLSDVNQTPNPALDSLESLKRRYQRQNRELAKANANQAQQIQALQAELSHKNAENIRLGSEIISLQRELDARDPRASFGVSDGTKRLLEDKLSELADIVRGLGDGGSSNGGGRRRLSGKRFPTAMKPDLSQRERPDGILQDIPELEAAGQVPTSPLFSAAKRNDMHLESPAKSYIPLDSAMFDIRPRRRRDSANVESLVALNARTEEQQKVNPGAKESIKRKYPDITEPLAAREEIEDRIAPPRLSDVNEAVSPEPEVNDPITVSQPAERTKDSKNSGAEAASKVEPRAPASPYRVDLASASRFVNSNRRSLENVQELARAQAQVQAPEPTPVAPVEPRRALEPKSTNIVNINNSPVKLPTIADFEYIKKEKPSPRDRDPVKKAARIAAKPIVVQGAENTMTPEKAVERNRRTRGVTVNYALPALNKKLRRESETLVDAVTGIQPKRRSVSNQDDALATNTAATATTTAPSHEGDRKSFKSTIEDLERRASRMTIHHDAPANPEAAEKKTGADRTAAESGVSDREIRKIISERTSRERDLRLEQARKDIYEFTTSNSPDTAEATRKTSGERHSLTAAATSAASIGGSHQRRTSGGIPTIGIGSKREGESRASTSNLKSASDLLEERRRRRATLGGATSATVASALAGDAKPRRTVGFADSVRDDSKSATGNSRESRRRSMVI